MTRFPVDGGAFVAAVIASRFGFLPLASGANAEESRRRLFFVAKDIGAASQLRNERQVAKSTLDIIVVVVVVVVVSVCVCCCFSIHKTENRLRQQFYSILLKPD